MSSGNATGNSASFFNLSTITYSYSLLLLLINGADGTVPLWFHCITQQHDLIQVQPSFVDPALKHQHRTFRTNLMQESCLWYSRPLLACNTKMKSPTFKGFLEVHMSRLYANCRPVSSLMMVQENELQFIHNHVYNTFIIVRKKLHRKIRYWHLRFYEYNRSHCYLGGSSAKTGLTLLGWF